MQTLFPWQRHFCSSSHLFKHLPGSKLSNILQFVSMQQGYKYLNNSQIILNYFCQNDAKYPGLAVILGEATTWRPYWNF